MPFIAVLCLVLLFLAAVGQSWFWRGPAGQPWYGIASLCWGLFLLALYITWPTLKGLGI